MKGTKSARSRRNRARLRKKIGGRCLGACFDSLRRPFIKIPSLKNHFFCVGWSQGLMEPHHPKNRKKNTHTAIEIPATRLAARPPMMPLARSRLRPATGPATEPVRARAAGARAGPAPTIPPAAGRSQRQPPHPPPLQPPLLAIPSPPRSSWHVQLLKPKLLLCPQLDLVGGHAAGLESPRAGVREVKVLARSSVVTPPQTPGRVKQRELLLLLAAAVATSSDGAT